MVQFYRPSPSPTPPFSVYSREKLMDFRGPGFFAVIFGSFPLPFSPSHVSKLDRRHTGRLRKRDHLLTGVEGGAGRSKIIRRRESLVLHNTFHTLWFTPPYPSLSCPTFLSTVCEPNHMGIWDVLLTPPLLPLSLSLLVHPKMFPLNPLLLFMDL
jgi:hypothetical protein